MKILMMSITIIFCSNVISGTISLLPEKDRYTTNKVKRVITTSTKENQNDSKELEKLKEIHEQNAKINEYLLAKQNVPFVIDNSRSFKIPTGSTLRGKLLNSIVSTNLESPIKIELYDNDFLPEGTTLTCQGVTKNKRVVTACNLLILGDTEEELEVNTTLLERDGSLGIRPDIVYTGKDLYVSSILANSFARGILEMGKERVVTPYGDMAKVNLKNKILEGLISSSEEANSMMADSLKEQSKEAKLFVNSGKDILVYFNRRFVK